MVFGDYAANLTLPEPFLNAGFQTQSIRAAKLGGTTPGTSFH